MVRASDRAADERPGATPPDPETLGASQRERRHRIVVSALHLLEDAPYEKIQMRHVAEHADVALGTMYRYFASKEHLFAAVLVEWSDLLGQRVQSRPLKGEDPAARLDDMMGRVLRSFERWPQFFGVVTVLETTPDTHARQLYAHFATKTTGTFREALAGLSDDDAGAIMDVANAVLSSLIRRWTLGLMPMAEARRRMSRSIELVFSEPPRVEAR